MKQELFYVAASRGREDIAIITSDANRLGESLGLSWRDRRRWSWQARSLNLLKRPNKAWRKL